MATWHTCPCGFRTRAYSNFHVHRVQCAAYHEASILGVRRLRGTAGWRPDCPWCEKQHGNYPLLFKHVRTCVEYRRRLDEDHVICRRGYFEAEVLAELDRALQYAVREAAFDAWCERHGR